MKKTSTKPAHECVPSQLGYYWATDRWGHRLIVLLGLDGFKHVRAFTHRSSSSRNPQDFTHYQGPIQETGS